ncbi:MAG TPA: hypothetical protein DCS15_09855 [Flavobacteriales bacterium]|jgi:SanA protein|nr:hypothetical protein [Flavobacteriales bacterium]
MRKFLNIFLCFSLIFGILFLSGHFLLLGVSDKVTDFSEPYCTEDYQNLPDCKVGVVLGTSKWVERGRMNHYFKYRIDAAVKLYSSGKVKYILVSGDNGTKAYNEPRDFKNMLLEKGIPEEKIILDYAGFRTFDSMVRAKEVFGQDSFIVVSQAFQNERAVFIARKKGVEAFGYNARNVSQAGGWLTRQREKFARIKLFLDLYLLDTKPKFLGEEIHID